MKIKKILSLILTALILIVINAVPFCALENFDINNSALKVLPGNPQSSSPTYSYAWLDNIIIRDSLTSFKGSRIVPNADYPYSHTFSDFTKEVENYAILHTLNEQTATDAYNELVNALYYVVTAMGMTDDTDTMALYLKENGITLPSNPGTNDKATIAVVYAAMKYNAVYAIYDKQVSIPKGISLNAAEIIIISEVTGVFLPSGVDSLTGFAVQAMKANIQQYDQIPLSNNPSNSEIFHWVKVITAAGNDYKLPLTPYDQATQAEKDYVDYAYYASIFETIYDVHINPAALAVADNDTSDMYAVQRLILRTMLESKGIGYSSDASCEELFNMACEAGFFMLEEEFYSDIFDYELYVASDCEKLWFTPFALASQLGSDNKYVKIYLEDKVIKPNATDFAELDLNKQRQDVQMQVFFDDTVNKESVTYMFHVIRTDDSSLQLSENGKDVVGQIETAIGSVIPSDNDKVNGILDDVKNSVDDVMESFPTFPTSFNEDALTTYSSNQTTAPGYNGNPEQASSGVDFDYLGNLLGNTYASGETVVATNNYTSPDEQEDSSQSIITRTVNVIKENPQIAAAPTGIIAVGGLVGYFMNKKRKDQTVSDEEISEEINEETTD